MTDHASGGYYGMFKQNNKSSIEKRFIAEKKKQPGVAFPSASKQDYILVVRIDLRSDIVQDSTLVKKGLRRLCGFLESYTT